MTSYYDQWSNEQDYSHNSGAGSDKGIPVDELVTDEQAHAFLATYNPRGVDRIKYVESGAYDFVCDAVQRGGAFRHVGTLRANARTFALLTHWAMAEGMPLKLELILDPEVIERFLITCDALSESSRSTDRLMLRRMSERLTKNVWPPAPVPGPPKDAKSPLDKDEVQSIEQWADAQHIERRWRAAQTWLVFGLGAGLSASAAADLRAGDIVEHGGAVLVLVRGKYPRVVPVTRAYESRARKLADGLKPYEYLHRPPGHVYKRAKDLSALLGPTVNGFPVNPWRLHRTWLIQQIKWGTPLNVIVDAAGRKRESGHWIMSLIPDLDAVDFDAYVDFLRGPTA